MLSRRQVQGIDRLFLVTTLLLLGIGLLSLYSAAYQKTQMTGVAYLQRQLVWAGLGCGLAVLLVVMDYHLWLEWSYLFYGLMMLLLAMVLVVGTTRGGAQRWLTLGGVTIQPSEFAKLTTILAVARYLGHRPPVSGRWRTVFGASLLFGVPMAMILKQPSLGTASVFGFVGLAMLLAWGIPLRPLLIVLGLGLLCVPLLWHFLEGYQRSRLLVFLNPNLDPLGAGYTVIQSRIAMGSGQFWGKGWLSGTQNQLNFLPERHTDFIFSVVGEEWGILGTTFCLGLYALLFQRGFIIAQQTRDPFGRLLIVGLITMLAAHMIVNMGMVLGLMPVVGLPLPFMSYGGSWLMTCLVAVGIVLSVAIRRPVF